MLYPDNGANYGGGIGNIANAQAGKGKGGSKDKSKDEKIKNDPQLKALQNLNRLVRQQQTKTRCYFNTFELRLKKLQQLVKKIGKSKLKPRKSKGKKKEKNEEDEEVPDSSQFEASGEGESDDSDEL